MNFLNNLKWFNIVSLLLLLTAGVLVILGNSEESIATAIIAIGVKKLDSSPF